MSKQQAAPGELEHVRVFVNTLDLEEGTDELADAGELAAFLAAQGLAESRLEVTEADLKRAKRLREALRAVLLSHNGAGEPPDSAREALDTAARRADLRLRFDEHGASLLEPAASGVDAALGRMLAAVHVAVGDGTWPRLKACREHTCAWAFYDHTKNRSGAWCNMAVCGNRAKARAYRERRASHAT